MVKIEVSRLIRHCSLQKWYLIVQTKEIFGTKSVDYNVVQGFKSIKHDPTICHDIVVYRVCIKYLLCRLQCRVSWFWKICENIIVDILKTFA